MFNSRIWLAALAMILASAALAPAAQAEYYTGEEGGKNVKTIMDGTANSNQVFVVGSYTTTCTGYSGSDEFATGMSKVLRTEQATYSDCSTVGATDSTVTTNGCEFKFGEPKKAGAGYTISSAEFACPVNKRVEIHIYTDKTHVTSLCTITIWPAAGTGTETIEEAVEEESTGENLEGGGAKTFVLNVDVKNLFYEEHGTKCKDAQDKKLQGATLTGGILWRGTNAKGTAIDALMSGP